METFSITLKNSIQEISRLAGELTKWGRSVKLSAAILNDVQLSVEEIISNIIHYGRAGAESEICLRIEKAAYSITIIIEDSGIAFNPLRAPEPDVDAPLEDRKIGGLGILLVKSAMDHLDYQRAHGKNRLILVKKL